MTHRPNDVRSASSRVSRRGFLGAAAAAAAWSPSIAAADALAHAGAGVRPRAPKKKLLVLGGTAFLGPAIVEAALAAGHEVTLFNRGKTNPDMFPDVEKLRGNRRRPVRDGQPPQDLSALKGRDWDAVIDTSGYFTANVEDMAKQLTGHVGQYLYVSSISVYRDLGKNTDPVHEGSPLATCEDRYAKTMGEGYERYGALKAYCEQAVEAAFPGKATLVRPGYIVGPRDSSERFTYWPMRFARGGEILAPGSKTAMQQFIDVRDLGEWIVRCCENTTTGAFNAVGFQGHISTEELLHTGKGTLNHDCSFTWVDDAFLQEHEVTSWGGMPCWCPDDAFNVSTNEKAIAAGLSFRPIAETLRDTLDWARTARPDGLRGAALSAARESELLAAFHARAGAK